jgi:glutaredoxin
VLAVRVKSDMKAVIWSKDNCPFCVKAKELLQKRGIAYKENRIGYTHTREEFFEENPGKTTVPQVYLDGNLIGGYQELNKYLEEN